jgi:hypothetical protein
MGPASISGRTMAFRVAASCPRQQLWAAGGRLTLTKRTYFVTHALPDGDT